MGEKILTLHPQGKSGVNIDKTKYDLMRRAIVDELTNENELTFNDLRDRIKNRINENFEGSVSWYFTVVKLDLEARGVVKRVGTGSPQRIRLA